MIDYETFSRIKHLHLQKGLTAMQIARELALDERTVKLWLAAKQFRPRKSVNRPSKLDPFKDMVVKMIESYQYTAQQVYQRIQEEGFTGGYSKHFLEFHKLRTRKSGHIRHIDMHLEVPKLMTVEKGHKLSHQISDDIEKRLDHSHVLVHIEPCKGFCDTCVVACPSKDYDS